MAIPGLDLHPEAGEEAVAAVAWYAERNPGAAADLLSEIERAFERILENPLAFPSHRRGTRRYVMRHFPYAIVYRIAAAGLQVIAVAHAKRRPGYWKERLADRPGA